jgi:hypothetical protein
MFGWIMLAIWILTVVGWIIFNLYRKNIQLENTVIAQANFIAGLQALIGESDKALKDLDDKIWLESDKELCLRLKFKNFFSNKKQEFIM